MRLDSFRICIFFSAGAGMRKEPQSYRSSGALWCPVAFKHVDPASFVCFGAFYMCSFWVVQERSSATFPSLVKHLVLLLDDGLCLATNGELHNAMWFFLLVSSSSLGQGVAQDGEDKN